MSKTHQSIAAAPIEEVVDIIYLEFIKQALTLKLSEKSATELRRAYVNQTLQPVSQAEPVIPIIYRGAEDNSLNVFINAWKMLEKEVSTSCACIPVRKSEMHGKLAFDVIRISDHWVEIDDAGQQYDTFALRLKEKLERYEEAEAAFIVLDISASQSSTVLARLALLHQKLGRQHNASFVIASSFRKNLVGATDGSGQHFQHVLIKNDFGETAINDFKPESISSPGEYSTEPDPAADLHN